MTKRLSDIGEFGFIESIKNVLPAGKGTFVSIGDDAAVVEAGRGMSLLYTADMLVEGVHFRHSSDPVGVGHKALACSLSDIAAMGGEPRHALVSIGLRKNCPVSYAMGIYKGISRLAGKFNVGVVGGDTVQSPQTVINVTVIGQVRKKDLVLRRTAKIGDLIFVTGSLGRAWQTGKDLMFNPRLKEIQFLLTAHLKPSAMIDISDGLCADLGHILEMSGADAQLDETRLPLNAGASLRHALYDGEDFELLFTLSPEKAKKLRQLKTGTMRFICIGEIVAGKEKLILRQKNGQLKVLPKKGYRHF